MSAEITHWLIITLITTLRVGQVIGADLLMAAMPDGKSHAGSFVPLLKELIRQGHNVTVFMDSYRHVSLSGGIKEWYVKVTGHKYPFDVKDYETFMWKESFTFATLRFPFYYGAESFEHVLADHKDEFIRIVAHPWDLVMTDSLFCASGYALAELSRAHHVMMHSTDVESGHGVSKGYARHYLTMPRYYMHFANPTYDIRKFMDRLMGAYEWFGNWFVFAVLANNRMKKASASVLPNFDFPRYNAEASMSFTDMPLALYPPMSATNELFITGATCDQPKELSGDWLRFVSDPRSSGTILLAFGTVLNWQRAPPEKREAFVNALNQLNDYRIIWSYNGDEVRVASHIRLARWIPQMELLNDRRTKLFITHGGLKSVKEAACASMPTIFMPMFAEQTRNSWLAWNRGFGKLLDKTNLTAESLVLVIREMIENPVYKLNALKLRRYYNDTPIPVVEEGAFRIKKLLKYGGRFPEYFYTRSTNFKYLTYLNLDLIIIVPVAFVLLLSVK